MAVLVEAVGAEPLHVSLAGDGEQLRLPSVVGDKPAFGPVLDGAEVLVERGGDRGAVTVGGNGGPESAVVGEHAEVVGGVGEEVVDEDEEQKWSKNAALGHTSTNREEVGAHAVDDHTLGPVRKKAYEP